MCRLYIGLVLVAAACGQIQGQTRVAGAQTQDQTRVAGVQVQDQTRVAGAQTHDQTRVAGVQVQDQTKVAGSQTQDQTRVAGAQTQDQTRVAGAQTQDQTRVAGVQVQDQTRVAGVQVQDQTRIAGAQVQGQTRVAGAHGSEVVKAVVRMIRGSCIFPDDKFFLRRLAFVETHNGDDADTYRAGYDGGIWKIDHDHFDQTKTSSNASALFSAIKSQFAIDWGSVQWSDLRKPLYSGLAAALYMSTISEHVERNLAKQGPYYAKYFRNSPDAAHNYLVEAQKLSQNTCERTNIDMAFLIDTSTSMGYWEIANAKKFAANVIDNFKISRDDVRVAFITFSTGYMEHFDFNRYISTKDIKDAINGVNIVGGETDTDKALDYATDTLFTSAKGSREGAAKIILILTDGRSGNPYWTVHAAIRAKHKGIMIFAIVVGLSIDAQLTDEVSQPTCSHLIQLKSFRNLSDLVEEIQEELCSARIQQPDFNVAIYKDSQFKHEFNGSMVVKNGVLDVYVQVTSEKKNDVMVVNSCDFLWREYYDYYLPLIENRCAVKNRTQILVTRYQVTRFRFKEVLNNDYALDDVFVTCKVIFCDVMDFSDKCQQRCVTSPQGAIIG